MEDESINGITTVARLRTTVIQVNRNTIQWVLFMKASKKHHERKQNTSYVPAPPPPSRDKPRPMLSVIDRKLDLPRQGNVRLPPSSLLQPQPN